MNQPTQTAMFDCHCAVASCGTVVGDGRLMCAPHWARVPDRLKHKHAFAIQEMRKAKSPKAIAECRRAVDVARQACVQAVAK